MAVNSQTRPSLNLALQQGANKPIATFVSQQIRAPYTSDADITVDWDRFIFDTTSGDLTATVPAAETHLIIGKPYIISKKSGANTLTIQLAAGNTFEGSDTIELTGDGDMVALISDGSAELKRAFPGQLSDVVPEGALAVDENLADLADADAALTNLGATAAGAAIVKGTAKYTFGPFALDTVAANADAVRFRPGFAGTITAMVLDLSKGTLDGTLVVTPTIAAGATTPASAQHGNGAAPGNQVDTAITAGGAFTADQEIVLAVTGTNTVAGKTMVSLEYTRS